MLNADADGSVAQTVVELGLEVVVVDGVIRLVVDLVRQPVQLFKSKNPLDLVALGKLLEEGWQLKKTLSPLVSNAEIDEYYERALS